eukprot:5105019-Amphidinium_carterae.3
MATVLPNSLQALSRFVKLTKRGIKDHPLLFMRMLCLKLLAQALCNAKMVNVMGNQGQDSAIAA